MYHFAVQGILQEKTLRYTQAGRAIAEFVVSQMSVMMNCQEYSTEISPLTSKESHNQFHGTGPLTFFVGIICAERLVDRFAAVSHS